MCLMQPQLMNKVIPGERKMLLTARLRVQPVSMRVEPLNAGKWVSGDVTLDQCAAPLPGNDLAHFSKHNWDEAVLRPVATLGAVSHRVRRQGPRDE